MNLSENLKRIRKDNNLSQEQLADKLGVSRQAVSKWESNQAYPEMDKVLQICKMFNLNIDELLNQNIKEVNETKQSKNNINKFIDDFLDYITKTIDLFTSMKFKDKVKLIFEQIILIGIITLVLLILGVVVKNIVSSLLNFLPANLYYTLYNILINGVYLLVCLILGTSLMLHIFKVRYLDYYVIVKDKKEEIHVDEPEEEQKEIKKKFFEKPEKETIIIREPKHSSYKFIQMLIKCLLWLIKFIVSSIGLCFSISFVSFVIALTLSLLFIQTGFVFAGVFLILVSCIIVNYLILYLCYTFIINKKRNNKFLGTSFLLSLVIIGVGTGLTLIGLKDFKYIDSTENTRYIQVEETLQMKDNSFIIWVDDSSYIEEERNDIKIVIKHSPFMSYDITEYENGHIEIIYYETMENLDLKMIIDDINNKKIMEYFNFEIKVYASKKNIEKLKQNRDSHIKEETEYYNHIEELNKQINVLENENTNYKLQIEELQNEIKSLQNEQTID